MVFCPNPRLGGLGHCGGVSGFFQCLSPRGDWDECETAFKFLSCSFNGVFPSLRKSMGLLYHPASKTVVTDIEKMILLGWPLFDEAATAAGVPRFEFPLLHRAGKFAGNAYHVACMGAFLATALACVRIT